MTNTQNLSDAYQRSGTDLTELREVLEEIDAMTILKKVTTMDIELLSLDRLRGIVDGNTAFRVFNPYEGETAPVGLPLDGPDKEKLKPLVKETRTNQLLLRIGGKVYFTAASMIYSMAARAGLGGSNISRPSGRRDAYIAELFGVDEKDVKMIVRRAGNVSKVFAMHSERYGRIPQITLLDIIEQIKHGLGKPVCRCWAVDHSRSMVELDFPEKAKDFARVYNISDHIIPGLRLVTSDVGEASVCAVGTWRIGKGTACSDVYTRKHTVKIDSKTILDQIDRQIFARYESVPKRLSELMLIDVSDPASCLSSVLIQMKQKDKDKFGKRRLQEITELLCQQFNPTLNYTAYDIAKTLLALPDTLKGLPAGAQKVLERVAMESLFKDYTEFKKELVVVAA